MSGGGSKTTQTKTSSPDLPDGVQGALGDTLGGARSLYSSGNLFKPYTGSTVVPYDVNTIQGQFGTVGAAHSAMPGMNAAFNTVSDMASGNGYNIQQGSAMKTLLGMSDGNGVAGAYARGDYLDGSNNPYFSKVVDRAAEGARDAVNMNFSGAGRYGSGANQQILAREVGDLTNRAYADQYNNEVGNMFTANAAQRGAAGDLFNAGQTIQSNKLQAASALPAAFQGMLAPHAAQMGIGAMNEDLNARQMNDNLRIWQEQQQQPMKSIEWLNGIASGQGQLTGGKTQSIQTPKPSPFMTGLGGASAGFALGGPVGAAIGGGAGLLGGLF